MSQQLPQTGVAPAPPGRFAVRFNIADKDKDVFLAAGAFGNGAIYTQHGVHIHILRRVIMRVGSFMNWLVLKLH
jgi:hypothetical protein